MKTYTLETLKALYIFQSNINIKVCDFLDKLLFIEEAEKLSTSKPEDRQ